MKSEDDLRRSMRAQYNVMRRSAAVLLEILHRNDPDEIRGVEIGDIRDEVEAITKAGHEFSAYHNAWSGKPSTPTKETTP